MKTTQLKYFLLLPMIMAITLPVIAHAEEGKVKITFKISKPYEGTLYMKILDDSQKNKFPNPKGVINKRFQYSEKQKKISLDAFSLPAGVYAISAYFDLNSDGKLNRNSVGAPKEPYGFSNNARGEFGPAKFKDAAFRIEKGKTVKMKIFLK